MADEADLIASQRVFRMRVHRTKSPVACAPLRIKNTVALNDERSSVSPTGESGLTDVCSRRNDSTLPSHSVGGNRTTHIF